MRGPDVCGKNIKGFCLWRLFANSVWPELCLRREFLNWKRRQEADMKLVWCLLVLLEEEQEELVIAQFNVSNHYYVDVIVLDSLW